MVFSRIGPKPLRLKFMSWQWEQVGGFSYKNGGKMYRKKIPQQLEFPNFYLPFSGQLGPQNRWVLLAQIVPWDLAEEIYHASLSPDQGAPIKPSRVALGALLIKEKLGLTDRETVAAI